MACTALRRRSSAAQGGTGRVLARLGIHSPLAEERSRLLLQHGANQHCSAKHSPPGIPLRTAPSISLSLSTQVIRWPGANRFTGRRWVTQQLLWTTSLDAENAGVPWGQTWQLCINDMVESELLVEYTLFEALPANADVLLFIMARSPNNELGYQLGAQFKDGIETAQFVYDITSSTQKKKSPEAVLTNQTVSGRS